MYVINSLLKKKKKEKKDYAIIIVKIAYYELCNKKLFNVVLM